MEEKNNSVESYNKHFSAHPERWANLSTWDYTMKALLESQCKDKNAKVLDMACGQGRFIKYIKNVYRNIMGLDYSSEAIKLAKKQNPEIEFVVEDANRTSFADKTFDAIISLGSHEHMKDPCFKEPYRILKDDGVFLAAIPNNEKGAGWVLVGPQYGWSLPQKFWIDRLTDAGFKINYEILKSNKDYFICRK